MKVLNSIPHDQWPNQRMLGEFLFHKLRTVRRFERVIDEIKRSADDSPLRDFDFLWSRLQEFLVEEREDANARSIEQSLKSPKRSANVPKAKTPAVPAKAAPAAPTNASAAAAPPSKAVPKKADVKSPPKGKSKGQGNHWVRKKTPRRHVSSIRCHLVVCMVPSVPAVIRKLHLRSRKMRVAQIQNQNLRLRRLQLPRHWRLLPSLLQQCFSHPRLSRLSGLRIQVLEDIWLLLKLWVTKVTTVLSLMVSWISLMKAFVSRQVVARRTHPFPLVSRSQWPIWESQSLYLGLMPHGSVDWTWCRTKWTWLHLASWL